MIDALFLNLLRTSLAVGAVILILLAVSPLWNRRFAALWKKRLWYLLAAVLLAGSAAAVPAGIARITIAIPARQVEIVRTEAGGAQIGITSQNQSAGTGDGTGADIAAPAAQESGGADAPQTKTARALDLLTAAELLWAAGALAWTLRMAVGESLFRRQLRRWARPVQSEALLSIYRELCAETGKGACPALLVCPGVGGPLLTGLLRPRLLLPTEDCAEPETRYILRHELAHWQSHDLWWKAVLLAANLAHWFNPAVWLMRRETDRDMERACDDRVMEGADAESRRAYGQVLLSAVGKGRQPVLSTYFCGGARAMRERLLNILSTGKRRGAALAVGCALLAVCMVPLVAWEKAKAAPAVPDGYELAATLPLSEMGPYHAVETAVSPQRAKVSDIAEILASRTLENGTEVLFYRAQDGNKYAACRAAGSDTLLRFTDEYNVYTDRYAIGTFTDLFGHDGFVLECPRGAAYYAYDYYYFDADGTPRLLADCSNYVIEQDLNGDGEKELLWFYHGAESYYYFERNGILLMEDVNGLLKEKLPSWTVTGVFPEQLKDGSLPIQYRLEGSDVQQDALLRFTPAAVEVYIPKTSGEMGTEQNWKQAQLTVMSGVPCVRYSDGDSWAALGPAIAPPREWKDEDVGGRSTAATLIGEPEIRAQLVSETEGWLAVTYGRGVAAADTYIYRTHDGGATWEETGQLSGALWHPSAAAFLDDLHGVVVIGLFDDAPVFVTADGGVSWQKADLHLTDGPWEAQSITADGPSLTMELRNTKDLRETVVSGDNGATWSVDCGAYQIGLRSGAEDDTLDIVLERDGTETILKTLQDHVLYESPENVTLRPFTGVLGHDGVVLSVASFGGAWYLNYYYAVEADGGTCIAESWGSNGEDDTPVDLDGDGIRELVCNVTFGADGVRAAYVYRVRDGAVECASCTDLPSQAENRLAHPASSVYDPGTQTVTVTYQLRAEEQEHVTEKKLDYPSLRFEPFVPDEAF